MVSRVGVLLTPPIGLFFGAAQLHYKRRGKREFRPPSDNNVVCEFYIRFHILDFKTEATSWKSIKRRENITTIKQIELNLTFV